MINPTSDSKEFSFSRVDVSCIMSGFSDDFLTSASMRDQDSYVIFNTYICYDKYGVLFDKRVFVDVVQSVLISS